MTTPRTETATVPSARRPTSFWQGTSLPTDILEQTCRRIGVASSVFAALWGVVLVMNGVVARFAPGGMPMAAHVWPIPAAPVAVAGLVSSLLMVGLAGRLHHRHDLLLNLGLGFEVWTALLISIVAQWEPHFAPIRVSWVCIIILAYPAIVPNTPIKTLAAALAAATMDPLAFGVALARDAPIEGPVTFMSVAWSFLPNDVCAVLAVIPAHIIRRLGRQVRRARELGSYRLGESIGRGGMGEVFRAEHRFLARPAAIKLIRPESPGSRRDGAARVLIERFRREAEAAAVLRSPHTIELYDFGVSQDGTFYYVMEMLDGVGLDTLVERFGPLPAGRAVHLILQACDSLAEAHQRGLIHRDVKPSNIFVSRLGLQVDFVKVLDFGLVKAERGSQFEATLLTAPELATGTPAYMAPEVALGEENIDHRIDVYGLGAVLYWLLTGQLVFEASNPIKMMHRHIRDAPAPPSSRTELAVPAELDALVLRCLAKSAADRPADASDLARGLAAVPVREPWTRRRSEEWWKRHLPPTGIAARPCDQGALVPVYGSED